MIRIQNNTIRLLRIAALQHQMRGVSVFDEFASRIEDKVRVMASYGVDALLLPEMITLELLSSAPKRMPVAETLDWLTEFSPALDLLWHDLARQHNLVLIAGSHICRDADGVGRNICTIALPDGTLYHQHKIHPTPNERAVWGIEGGTDLPVIDMGFAKAGVLICYDSEFPEAARHLAAQGAEVIFVPYCTDTLEGHVRVRLCSHARCVENQVFVATAGLCGYLPNVENADIHHAKSAILTPSDHSFPPHGIAAEASENIEQMIFADLDIAALRHSRTAGSVTPYADRRPELYAQWLTQAD